MTEVNIPINDEIFLKNLGGIQQNSLNHILQDTDINYTHISSYYDTDSFNKLVNAKNSKRRFSLLSTNIQSINSKFSELEAYILKLNKLEFDYSAICLQESWLSDNDDISQLQATDYNIIAQGKQCSTKAGLLTYLHKNFNYTILNNQDTPESQKWEYQIVKLTGGGLNPFRLSFFSQKQWL